MDPRRRRPIRRIPRIPRARGDGPRARSAPRIAPVDSPRSRGWTRTAARRPPARGGFPALAGMDPGQSRTTESRTRIPRARGDGPLPGRCWGWRSRDSPRSRGWTREKRQRGRRLMGFPALAGMDPATDLRGMVARGIPRARGDGPGQGPGDSHVPMDSPRSRGWTPIMMRDRAIANGFPALAGMDRRLAVHGVVLAGIPRARGDGPWSSSLSLSTEVDSPRSRGWTPPGRRDPCARSGFPALAGMDPPRRSACASTSRIPRARGDGPGLELFSVPVFSDSPRSRGWTRRRGPRHASPPGFPALAGMDPFRRGDTAPRAGIPRARGDGPVT